MVKILVCKNALKLDNPSYFKIIDAVNAIHAVLYSKNHIIYQLMYL